MNIRTLRQRHPDWTWKPKRYGMGWSYHGRNRHDKASVVMRAYSVLCGPGDDDCETQWRVESANEPTLSYSSWWMLHGARV